MTTDPSRRRAIAGLYAIADPAVAHGDLSLAVDAACRGGAALIQYRDKHSTVAEKRRLAAALAQVCRTTGVPLLVNDDPALAAAVGAAGVHLGRNDAALPEARRLLGASALIGVSCYNSLDRAAAAVAAGADYIAFGSFFPSAVKPDAVRAELDLLRAARQRWDIPVVAIGGISPDNGARLIEAGADALAVISGVFAVADVRAAAAQYAALFARRDVGAARARR